jgi:hypothetical protein
LGLLDSVRELSCDRDHYSDGGHVGCLGLGVRGGGEGDVPSSLLPGVKLLGPLSLLEPFTTTCSGWLVVTMVVWVARAVVAAPQTQSRILATRMSSQTERVSFWRR